ncbi:MAG: hypothetical protein M3R11_09640 [Acidobacteriota bacterium]|nr:hypothetical protein [Acidobacteriota bacterium]
MSLAEVLPNLKTLNRSEKLRVVKILIDEITSEEESFFESGAEYEIWSPYDSYDAAEKLQQMLEENKSDA